MGKEIRRTVLATECGAYKQVMYEESLREHLIQPTERKQTAEYSYTPCSLLARPQSGSNRP